MAPRVKKEACHPALKKANDALQELETLKAGEKPDEAAAAKVKRLHEASAAFFQASLAYCNAIQNAADDFETAVRCVLQPIEDDVKPFRMPRFNCSLETLEE